MNEMEQVLDFYNHTDKSLEEKASVILLACQGMSLGDVLDKINMTLSVNKLICMLESCREISDVVGVIGVLKGKERYFDA